MRGRGVRLLVLSVSFFSFLSLAGCASPDGGATAGAKFWTPQDPPGATYAFDVKIDVAGEEVALSAGGTISLVNSSPRPLSVLAFEWTVTPGREFAASVSGRPLAVLNAERGQPLTTPLLVALPEPVRPGAKAVIEVRFTHRAALGNGQAHLGLWYPRLWWDGLRTKDAFKVKLAVPAGFAVAASGRLDRASGAYENDSVASHFGIFLSNVMKTERREAAGVELTALFTDKGRDCALFCLDAAAEIIAFYKDWLGFYPHPSLTILPGGARPMGGYPYASGLVVVHGQETFDPAKDKRENWWWTWITAHEIGHQYWGESVLAADVLGEYTENWLMIGLGICADKEYMLRQGYGWDRHRGFIDRYLAGVLAGNDTTMDAPPSLVKAQDFDRNNVLIHGKGFAVLSALETVLGSEAYDRLYRRTARDHAGRRLGWREFRRLAEAEAGEDLGWFFEDWVRSNKVLECRIVECSVIASGGVFRSDVRTEYGLDSIRMPVPVRAVFEDGTTETATTDRLARTNLLRFYGRSPLKEAVLDPDRRLGLVEAAPPKTAAQIEEAVEALDWTGTGEAAREFVRMPAAAGIAAPHVWFKLGLLLFDGRFYPESLEAFRTCRGLSRSDSDLFGALVWMGHISDLLGDRDEAVARYAEALRHDSGRTLQHDQYGMRLDRRWVEERLKSPFTWTR